MHLPQNMSSIAEPIATMLQKIGSSEKYRMCNQTIPESKVSEVWNSLIGSDGLKTYYCLLDIQEQML